MVHTLVFVAVEKYSCEDDEIFVVKERRRERFSIRVGIFLRCQQECVFEVHVRLDCLVG